ncbi:hypothetical protein Hdeb2414_s0008g00282631 [Helianthus debilis subsp. tardiflorus]
MFIPSEESLLAAGKETLRVMNMMKDKKLRWWPIYREPEHEVVGKIQLHINYTTSLDGVSEPVPLTPTMAYDLLLKGATKTADFHTKNMTLSPAWKWLLSEFASSNGVSEAYTNLRYLSRVMDVATPTANCVSLVYELFLPVMKGHNQNTLNCLEKRSFGDIKEQIEHFLTLVYENYMSLDDKPPSGIMDIPTPDPRVAVPVLKQAVKLYELIHNISSLDAQNKLYSYFQAAASKGSRRIK